MFPSGEKINAYISEQIHAGASVNTNHRGIEYACRIHQNSLPYLDVCKAGQERGQGTWEGARHLGQRWQHDSLGQICLGYVESLHHIYHPQATVTSLNGCLLSWCQTNISGSNVISRHCA